MVTTQLIQKYNECIAQQKILYQININQLYRSRLNNLKALPELTLIPNRLNKTVLMNW